MRQIFPVLNANRLGAIELIELGRPSSAFIGSTPPRPQEPFLSQMRREGTAGMGAGATTTVDDVLAVAVPVTVIAGLAWLALRK